MSNVRNAAGEGTLLVNVMTFDGSLGSGKTQTNILPKAQLLLFLVIQSFLGSNLFKQGELVTQENVGLLLISSFCLNAGVHFCVAVCAVCFTTKGRRVDFRFFSLQLTRVCFFCVRAHVLVFFCNFAYFNNGECRKSRTHGTSSCFQFCFTILHYADKRFKESFQILQGSQHSRYCWGRKGRYPKCNRFGGLYKL